MPRNSCERITPELPRAPISAPSAIAAVTLLTLRSAGASASSRADWIVASVLEPVSPSGTGNTLSAFTSSTCAAGIGRCLAQRAKIRPVHDGPLISARAPCRGQPGARGQRPSSDQHHQLVDLLADIALDGVAHGVGDVGRDGGRWHALDEGEVDFDPQGAAGLARSTGAWKRPPSPADAHTSAHRARRQPRQEPSAALRTARPILRRLTAIAADRRRRAVERTTLSSPASRRLRPFFCPELEAEYASHLRHLRKSVDGWFQPPSSSMNRVRAHRRYQPNLQPLRVVKGQPRQLICNRCRRTLQKDSLVSSARSPVVGRWALLAAWRA